LQDYVLHGMEDRLPNFVHVRQAQLLEYYLNNYIVFNLFFISLNFYDK